jgi:hypothetical protein
MLLFYQVATSLSLTTCWQIVELQDDNKLLEQLVTSLLNSTTLEQVVNKPLTTCQQARNKQCEHIPLTSCWNSIAIQVCCRFVTITCAFLRVYSQFKQLSTIRSQHPYMQTLRFLPRDFLHVYNFLQQYITKNVFLYFGSLQIYKNGFDAMFMKKKISAV